MEKKKEVGPVTLPKWLRQAYMKAVGYTCEDCRKTLKESQLEIHRIKPGYRGGTYRPGNCKILCTDCHLKYAEPW